MYDTGIINYNLLLNRPFIETEKKNYYSVKHIINKILYFIQRK